ncbi:MAG: alpha-amylase family glycosyl hydrolase [Bacteroidota bacterium]|nr:alpha-amylase family glycosyl hydrolase [Bacteroidota bacterium]
MTLNDPAVIEALKANPATTLTANGTLIPYPFPSPADWRDHWIYFLLVDRFNNPSSMPDPNVMPCNTYQGGKFAGIRQRLPYLKELGAGAIWLSPVLINPQWFNDYWGGYGIFDFLRIEPRFCGNPDAARQDPSIADKEFRDLVDEAHAMGIYVILDIVLNHTGDLFDYEGMRDTQDYRPTGEYKIFWRNEDGVAQGDWTEIADVNNLSINEGVWPKELQRDDYFRRKGTNGYDGDFNSLRELVTEYQLPGTGVFPVRTYLIRAYQYLIAKFDLDGYRIDTLQYVEPEFARAFGNSMREYALSIGKKNFFTFGEVWQDDNEQKIAEFVGRDTEKDSELIGVDAAIDFPMRKRLVEVCKGFAPPSVLAKHFDTRRETLKRIVSSHGDAGKYYVTFLDNHDLSERFHNAQFPEQTKLALTCLMTMQGIPCIYYGTEQGLDGHGDRREYVREALWGRQDAFSTSHPLYHHIHDLSVLINEHPALRYGRQYFRTCSGNGTDFDYSPFTGGVIAFSRILNDKEILVVANTSVDQPATMHVVVDKNLNAEGRILQILFPFAKKGPLANGCESHGMLRTVKLTVAAGEALVIG